MGISIHALSTVLVVASMLAAAVQRSTTEPRTIKGVIVDPAGAPIADASVRLIHDGPEKEPITVASTNSDRKGAFRLQTAKIGRHELQISPKQMPSITIKLDISGDKKEIDVGTVKLPMDCSAPGTNCDDFGLRENKKDKNKNQ